MPLKCLTRIFLTILILAASALAQLGPWEPLATNGAPSDRFGFGFASDLTSDFHVMFGGHTALSGELAETWLFDGTQSWTQLTPTQSPSPRSVEMVFDSARGVFVLYGGVGPGVTILGETWEFDGVDWTQVSTPGIGTRGTHVSSYDPFLQEVLLFGGTNAAFQGFSDLWSFDGSNWTNRTPVTSPSPSPRQGARLVYDSARGVHVLFGGVGGFFVHSDETWEFSAGAGVWAQVMTPTVPPARFRHAMEYDANLGMIVMHGGLGPGVTFGDTWVYDGNDWTELTTSLAPEPRSYARFTATTNGLLLHGGTPSGNDTWRFGGAPPRFPGSGSDSAIRVGVNGNPLETVLTPVAVAAGDSVRLNCRSIGESLEFARFAMVGSTFATSSPPSGLPLLGVGPSDVWIDPAIAFVVVDGLGPPTSVFVPTLVPGGLDLGPYLIPPGLSGQSLNLQVFVQDAPANPFGISTSNAVTLEFQ